MRAYFGDDPGIEVGARLALRYLEAAYSQLVAGTDDDGTLGADVVEDYTEPQLEMMGLGMTYLATMMLGMFEEPHDVLNRLRDKINQDDR